MTWDSRSAAAPVDLQTWSLTLQGLPTEFATVMWPMWHCILLAKSGLNILYPYNSPYSNPCGPLKRNPRNSIGNSQTHPCAQDDDDRRLQEEEEEEHEEEDEKDHDEEDEEREHDLELDEMHRQGWGT